MIADIVKSMPEATCKKCSVVITEENCYNGWFKKAKYICKACARLTNKTIRLNLKIETIAAYGDNCACCSESQIEFLTIDHIDGNGAEHRRSLGLDYGSDEKTVAGHNFYRILKKQGFPKENYQVLCFNCNYAKHVYGKCPHHNS